jgi:hypothetical protein
MRATSGLEPSDETRMSLAGGELDGVRARAKDCGLSDRDLLRGADVDDLPPGRVIDDEALGSGRLRPEDVARSNCGCVLFQE